jgi:hypothetical protein
MSHVSISVITSLVHMRDTGVKYATEVVGGGAE